MGKSRILHIDVLKLFSIYLVLWGHAIMQFQPNFQHSIVYQTIYSFHMPLFMMLSGYFAESSMDIEWKGFFTKKFRQLLLPCISWGILCWLVITSGLIKGVFHLRLKELFTGWLGLIDNFWFLKSCFICYTLSWLCYRCGRYRSIAIVVVWFLCTLQGRFHLDMMFPCFIVGMYLRKNENMRNEVVNRWYIPLSIFVLLLFLKLCHCLGSPMLKLIIGLSGAFGCYGIFGKIIDPMQSSSSVRFLAEFGKETLGIYINKRYCWRL